MTEKVKKIIKENEELLRQGQVARVLSKCPALEKPQLVRVFKQAGITFNVPNKENIIQVFTELGIELFEVEYEGWRKPLLQYKIWMKRIPEKITKLNDFKKIVIEQLYNTFFNNNIIVDHLEYKSYNGFDNTGRADVIIVSVSSWYKE